MRTANPRPHQIARLAFCLSASLLVSDSRSQSNHLTAAEPEAAWLVEYTVTGGVAGRVEHISVRQDGLTKTWSVSASTQESTISAAELAEIRSLVMACRLTNTTKPAESQIPDMISSALTMERDGRLYYIGPEGKELAQALDRIFEQKTKEAEDAKWAKAGPFHLGRVWKVQEEIRDPQGQFHGDYWLGTWTRRGDTNLFDAVWRDSRTGEEVRDVMQFDSAQRGSLTLHRLGTHQIYLGSWRAEQMNVIGFGSIRTPGSAQRSWWGSVEE